MQIWQYKLDLLEAEGMQHLWVSNILLLAFIVAFLYCV